MCSPHDQDKYTECDDCGCVYDGDEYSQCPQCEEALGTACPVCGRDLNAFIHRNCGDSSGPY